MDEKNTKEEVSKHLAEVEATVSVMSRLLPMATADGLTDRLSLIEAVEEELYQSKTKLQLLRYEMRKGQAG